MRARVFLARIAGFRLESGIVTKRLPGLVSAGKFPLMDVIGSDRLFFSSQNPLRHFRDQAIDDPFPLHHAQPLLKNAKRRALIADPPFEGAFTRRARRGLGLIRKILKHGDARPHRTVLRRVRH